MKRFLTLLAQSSLRCFLVGVLLGTVVGYAAFQNKYLSISLVWSATGFLAGVVVGYIIRAEVQRHSDNS
jgi:hypothetical protein